MRRAFAYGRGAGRDFAHGTGGLTLQLNGALFALALVLACALMVTGTVLWWIPLAVVLVLAYLRFARLMKLRPADRKLERPLYPLTALIEEVTGNVGFVLGYLRH
jgi:Flp pilus assembly protein TadB